VTINPDPFLIKVSILFIKLTRCASISASRSEFLSIRLDEDWNARSKCLFWSIAFLILTSMPRWNWIPDRNYFIRQHEPFIIAISLYQFVNMKNYTILYVIRLTIFLMWSNNLGYLICSFINRTLIVPKDVCSNSQRNYTEVTVNCTLLSLVLVVLTWPSLSWCWAGALWTTSNSTPLKLILFYKVASIFFTHGTKYSSHKLRKKKKKKNMNYNGGKKISEMHIFINLRSNRVITWSNLFVGTARRTSSKFSSTNTTRILDNTF
jgi:hypothetical protein